ncbi:hypothetical protein ACHAPI_007108 [Fusarium lateritium]
MAETVGIIAASGQFVEQSIKIVKLTKQLRDKFKGAPEELEDWRDELESLQRIVDKIHKTPALNTENLERIATQCKLISDKLLDLFCNIDFKESDSLAHKSWRVVVSLAKEEEIRDLFTKLERWKLTLSTEITSSSAIQSTQAHETFAHTASVLDEIKQSFRPGTEEDKCIRSLFVTDPLSDREGLVTIKGHRTPGTFEWIPNTKQYQDWDTAENGLLWIAGPPGKGKTMISIFLSKRLEMSKPNSTVIWFFCDNKTSTRNSAANVIRGLMTQLIQKHPRVISCLLPTWKVQDNKMFQANSFETLWRSFLNMLILLKNEKVYCVLDALDECDKESLSSLLFKVKTLFDPSQNDNALNSFKLIIASREQPLPLPQSLSEFPRITLGDLGRDIELYITEKVNHLARSKNIQGSPIQQRIESALKRGAEGTFLWVSYVTQDLEQKTLDEIDAALTQLPPGLYDIYDRVVSKVKTETRGYVAEMIRWILRTAQPLNISELCDAIEVKPTDFLTREQVCLGYVQSCDHLLQLQAYDWDREMWTAYKQYDTNSAQDSTGSIDIGQLQTTFLHQSAKDFFLAQRISSIPFLCLADTQKGHTMIVERLVEFLKQHLCSGPPDIERRAKLLEQIPLLTYAVNYLTFHVRQLSEEIEGLIRKNEILFGKASKLRDYWWWWYKYNDRFFGDLPLLHVACAENLYHLARALLQPSHILTRLKRRRDINTQWGPQKQTPLHMAVSWRSSRIVQLLLEHGANVSIIDEYGESPLHYAMDQYLGYRESIYKMLSTSRAASKIFKNEVKHQETSPTIRSLLHSAAESGDYNMCRELIEVWRYSIEQVDRYGRKPVHYALEYGHVRLFHQMVKHWSADLGPHHDLFVAAMFHRASGRASVDGLFKMLIEDFGCDINATDTTGSTIFHHWNFNYKVMQTVSDLGLSVDWNKRNFKEETFIHSNKTWLRDPRLLIVYLQQSQLSINTQDNWERSPLHLYCLDPPTMFNGHTLDVRMLLDFGADRHLKDKDGKVALDVCVSVRDYEIADKYPTRERVELLEETIKLLASYSTVVIDPRKVNLRHDSEKWLDPMDRQNSSS